jgi:hypothetical protein
MSIPKLGEENGPCQGTGRAYLNLTAAMTIVGSSVVFGKIITHAFPVFQASGLRFAIASIIVTPLVLRSEKQVPRLGKND